MENKFMKKQIDKSNIWYVVVEFLKFGAVGASNTLISLFIYYFLVFFNVNYFFANTIAFGISVINAYYWNSKHVFKCDRQSNRTTFIKMFCAYFITFLLSMLVLYVTTQLLLISKLIAPIISLFITVPLNFLLNKLWVFK